MQRKTWKRAFCVCAQEQFSNIKPGRGHFACVPRSCSGATSNLEEGILCLYPPAALLSNIKRNFMAS